MVGGILETWKRAFFVQIKINIQLFHPPPPSVRQLSDTGGKTGLECHTMFGGFESYSNVPFTLRASYHFSM